MLTLTRYAACSPVSSSCYGDGASGIAYDKDATVTWYPTFLTHRRAFAHSEERGGGKGEGGKVEE